MTRTHATSLKMNDTTARNLKQCVCVCRMAKLGRGDRDAGVQNCPRALTSEALLSCGVVHDGDPTYSTCRKLMVTCSIQLRNSSLMIPQIVCRCCLVATELNSNPALRGSIKSINTERHQASLTRVFMCAAMLETSFGVREQEAVQDS